MRRRDMALLILAASAAVLAVVTVNRVLDWLYPPPGIEWEPEPETVAATIDLVTDEPTTAETERSWAEFVRAHMEGSES